MPSHDGNLLTAESFITLHLHILLSLRRPLEYVITLELSVTPCHIALKCYYILHRERPFPGIYLCDDTDNRYCLGN